MIYETDTHPENFDLLGFTHYAGGSLRGKWVVKRETSGSRLSRAVRAIPTRGNEAETN